MRCKRLIYFKKNVDYQCLMPIAALSFHQQNLSFLRKFLGAKEGLLSIEND